MTSIIIECLQHRPRGQNIHFAKDGTAYTFLDDGNGRQIAVVADPNHQSTFLGIPSGFRFVAPAPDDAKPFIQPGETPTGPAAAAWERGQTRDPQPAQAAAEPVDPVAAALEVLRQHRPDLLSGALAAPAPAAPETAPAAAPPTDPEVHVMDLAGLRKLFKAETGANPSPKHSAEALVGQIIAHREAAREAAANAQA